MARLDATIDFERHLSNQDSTMHPESAVRHSPDDRGLLLETIHDRVLPTLSLAHAAPPLSARALSSESLDTTAEVSELARIAAIQDLAAALELVEVMVARGVSVDSVLLSLVAPAARLLRTDWETDVRSFTEVAIARGTLKLLVHVVGERFSPSFAHRGPVVLVAAPSEQHALGVYILEELLRHDGWEVRVAPSVSESALVTLVKSERVAMLGISATLADAFEPLVHLVAAVKKASLNRELAVMLNGSPELGEQAARIGAGLCAEPRDASRWVQQRLRARYAGRGS